MRSITAQDPRNSSRTATTQIIRCTDRLLFHLSVRIGSLSTRLIMTMIIRNWTRYAISEPEFRSAYAAVSAHGSHGLSATNPNDVRFLPLLFVVLAISVRLAPEELAGDARHRRITSLRYYWSCECLLFSIYVFLNLGSPKISSNCSRDTTRLSRHCLNPSTRKHIGFTLLYYGITADRSIECSISYVRPSYH